MLAVKTRRASDYVLQSPAPKVAEVVALVDDAVIDAVPSPARLLQAELAARLAGDVAIAPGRSLRRRTAMVFGMAIAAWVPIAVTASLMLT